MHFFASSIDVKNVTSFMIKDLGFTVYEAYSEFDQPIKQIFADIEVSKLEDRNRNILVRGWHDECQSPPIFHTIKSNKSELFTTRTRVTNLTQIQINKQKLMDNGCLYPTYLSHWTEKGAKQRSNASLKELEAVDWIRFKSISLKLKRHIKSKMSVAKLNSMVILPDAFEKYSKREFYLWNWGEIVEPDSTLIEKTT